MYDCIIIGGGPAGLAAAIYFARQKLRFAMVTGDVGGQTLLSTDVENYLGFHLLNGQELVDRFRKHLDDYKDTFDLKEGELVESVEKITGGFRVHTKANAYEGKTLLITTGTKHRELGVPGEKELYGHGVTYCATCDAPLFGGKRVAVIGGGNSAMDAALFAAKYASSVTVVTVNTELRGDEALKAQCLSNKKINVVTSSKTVRINGEKLVTGIVFTGADGKEQELPCEGVLIEVGVVPVSGFIDLIAKDQWGQIVVDKANATNVEGIWAAGDVTDVTEKQIGVAVGEGSKASLTIIKYLQKQA